ncbi:MAG: type II toxin-antitoxin system YafQ family toxin [bacterium]|nr:type II toxin-antitoxin system YafQ family toxin [bacterium]
MQFPTHREFERRAKKLPQAIHEKVWQRITLMVVGEFNPILNNHKLNPPYEGYRSINITGDYRLVYKKLATDTYYLRAVGTHHQLFGS